MGLALPALAGALLPERSPADAARLLAIRHAGIALALVAIAPIAAADLDRATERARLRGVALVLDADLPARRKLDLAPELLAGVEAQDPRAGLERALAEQRPRFTGEQRFVFDRLGRRADETLVLAIGEASRRCSSSRAASRCWRRWSCSPARADRRAWQLWPRRRPR